MKYYEINKRISYAIIAFSSAILVLWITNVTLHYTKTQWTDINLNLWFVTAVSSCGYTYPLSSSSSFPIQSSSLSVGSTITTTNLIYTQYIVGYHSIYQKINICFLFMLGGWMLIVLLMSIFLLLKSRYPYK